MDTGSWADEMEDMPIYSRTGYGAERRTYNSSTGAYGGAASGGYSVREELPLPSKPPYTVHLGNLSFDATVGDVTDFFTGCECINVRIIEDKMEMKPKGFGYAEFQTLEGLKSALTLNQTQFQGRNIRISVADPPKDRDGPTREFNDWSRKGPLPDLPSRGGDRRTSDRGGFGGDFGGERRERGAPEGDGKIRDFGNWERKGPLSPVAQPDRSGPREGGRPRTNDGPRQEGFRDRRASPAQWGEGRPQGSQDGSRPPRREFQERAVPDRAPTAAEQDSQWRTKMRPDAPAKSPVPSRDGSEAPSSPAVAPATLPGGRPKLNLAKRTVSEAPDLPSPSSVSGDAKASPFGAARPIDTAAKEKELEEKRVAALAAKKEAEEKAKAEAKEAAEKAKAEEAEKAEKAEADQKVEILQREETIETENANGEIVDDKAVKPKEIVRDAKPKPVETGAWRRASNGPPTPRDDTPRGPRGDGGRGRGGRGRGEGRGGRHYEERGPRRDMNGGKSPASPAQPPAGASETQSMEEDGWSTVSKPKKNNRGGNAASRAIAS
ncbi:putative RNA-binding protein sce3 [Glarea lozoyensis 74030]|uniref:Putative RNA-binding protein sce3 n=1 Tax=Glarea lozoyensis (strain ATCC 74030 / MF5533) TaxID=1104152 RepID=H0EXV9_GLAL7|nr:putative RNA-binding protein sce3 [Glarea lozoyensis 74030]